MIYKLILIAAFTINALLLTAREPINVATFNIRMKTEKDGANVWRNRVEHLKSLIVYHEFEIIGTQEGFKSQLEDIASIPDFAYVGVGRDDGESAGEHSAIFYKTSRFELVKNGDFWLSEETSVPNFGWDAACKRICSWAELRDTRSGETLYVFNVHFDHKGDIARLESAKLVIRKVKEIAGRSPVVLCGDFNLRPESDGISIIKNSLRDSYDISESPPYGPYGTANGFDLTRELDARIDYIFVTDNISIKKYAALSDIKDNRFPSDHLPVVVKLSLKE